MLGMRIARSIRERINYATYKSIGRPKEHEPQKEHKRPHEQERARSFTAQLKHEIAQPIEIVRSRISLVTPYSHDIWPPHLRAHR